MNREEYLDSLEEKNGYCNCNDEELRGFYKLRKKIQESPDRDEIRRYNAKMAVLIHRGKLGLMSHNPDDFSEEKISPREIDGKKIITVHCPLCSQQIDTLD